MNDVYDRNQKKALIADNDRLRTENANLSHDIERHIAIASQLATENVKLRAALERLETASGSGEISGSLFKQGEGFMFVGAYIRAALNEETK